MENLEEIITFTASGSFKRGTVNAFAEFLGYKDIVETSATESAPNPYTKVEYVQLAIKQLFVTKMAEMAIAVQKPLLEEEYQSQLLTLTQSTTLQVASDVEVTTEIK